MNEITSICYFAQENLDKGYDVQMMNVINNSYMEYIIKEINI